MGVPKFASWLTKKYPAMISDTCPQTTHGLYVDLNGLIHPCCHSERNPSVARRPEAEKLQRICHEIEQLVETVQPKAVLYIATDGVAPRAKMNQQRARRYMTVAGSNSSAAIVEEVAKEVLPQEIALADAELENVREELMQDPLYGNLFGEVKNSSDVQESGEEVARPSNDILGYQELPNGEGLSRGDIPREEEIFDSNCITPGTVFMSKVADAVRGMVEEKLLCGDPLWEKLHVIVSTSQTPGEGEQKIMDFIRTQSSYSGFIGKEAHVIVGLDADIVFLALSLHIPHVFILRYQGRSSYAPKRASSPVNSNTLLKNDTCTQQNKVEKGHKEAEGSGHADDVKSEKNGDGDNGETTGNELTNMSGGDGETNSPQLVAVKNPYDYYDMDVVGTSIASEFYGLCQLKNFVPREADAFAPHSLISSGGYYFYRQSGSPEGKEFDGTAFMDEHGVKKEFHPCVSLSNSKLIDDFIVIGMLMGNDFLPRLPSAFCGESAMDNLMEVYITDVLPYGYLTSGNHEINLTQLRRLFSSYAKVETSKFRHFAVLSNRIQSTEAAATLHAPVDECWREPYLKSTGLAAHMDTACEKYIQGLRFVWRYYSATSSACSWSWFYPFHHAPFALDLADFLWRATPDMLQPPPLEISPPNALVQLLCVLPPTSHSLVPAALGEVMLHPPLELRESFPTTWQVDFAGAYGKEYLAVVMLPFADVEQLREIVSERWPRLSQAEQQLAEQIDYHIVMRRSDEHAGNCDAGVDTFHLNGDVRELGVGDTTWTLRSGITYEALYDSLPQRSRPRVYASTEFIPRLMCNSSNRSEKRERRFPRDRYKRRNRKASGSTGVAKKTQEVQSNDDVTCIIEEGPSFAEVLIAFAVVSVSTASAVSISAVLQVLALNLAAIALTFFLGIAVKNPHTGSGICRNNVRATYVDWLCPECLSLNFSRNNRCFICHEPVDVRRCLAVFRGIQPPTPPLMEPNHTHYIETVSLHLQLK